MRTIWLQAVVGAGCVLLLAMGLAAQAPKIARTNLKVGQAAPDFTLLSDTGQAVHLADFRGKKSVILAFYVLAFTGG